MLEHKERHMESEFTFLQYYHDGDDFLDRIIKGDATWVAHITPKTKQHSMHLASEWITLQDEIQADFVGADSDVQGVLGQTRHSPRRLPEQKEDGECLATAKYCRNCNGTFRTSDAGCLVTVLSCCTKTFGHTRLDCQHIS